MPKESLTFIVFALSLLVIKKIVPLNKQFTEWERCNGYILYINSRYFPIGGTQGQTHNRDCEQSTPDVIFKKLYLFDFFRIQISNVRMIIKLMKTEMPIAINA